MDFERLSYRIRTILQPSAGWHVQVLPPGEDDSSPLAEITRQILASAHRLLREGMSGTSLAPSLSFEAEELLSDDPDGRDVLHLSNLLRDLVASRVPAL